MHKSDLVADGVILVGIEPCSHVEALSDVDVRHWDSHEFEFHIHAPDATGTSTICASRSYHTTVSSYEDMLKAKEAMPKDLLTRLEADDSV